MKRIIVIALAAIFICSAAFAEHVDGYMRKNGTYVQGYERSSPNSTVKDNYSYVDSSNPYTGQKGTNYYRDNPTSAYYGTSSSRSKSSSSSGW